jgi:hypothetical protein
MSIEKVSEAVIKNIILDDSPVINEDGTTSNLVLFSSLKPGIKPIKDYKLNTHGIEYPKYFSAKCAICNSPHRELLEHVYVDRNKNINGVIKFFEEHYNAKLNWPQIKHHLKFHCDMNKIETPGLLDYEDDTDIVKWKFREYELALIATLKELDDVRGMTSKTFEEQTKKTQLIDRLTTKLLQIKSQRDDLGVNLPNVFEVLYQVHEMMVSEDDKRIIREKVKELKQRLA